MKIIVQGIAIAAISLILVKLLEIDPGELYYSVLVVQAVLATAIASLLED